MRKTENYKLAEALKSHSRDLLLLSATPHQGNHFQFWMLIQLLNPTLFAEPGGHAGTPASAQHGGIPADQGRCLPSRWCPLFARRWVHTESFLMGEEERGFYERLRDYLEDGFNLARRKGNKGERSVS